MPNWCVNHMKITGAAGEITRFKQTCIIDGKLDFNTIIPQPLAWALFADSGELPTDPTMSKAWWERYHLCLAQWKEATGYDHPNDWAIEHWGTKWNASEFRVATDQANEFACAFATAWDPPDPVWEKMGEMFPTLTFELSGKEPNMAFAFEGSIRDGQMDFQYVEYIPDEKADEDEEEEAA